MKSFVPVLVLLLLFAVALAQTPPVPSGTAPSKPPAPPPAETKTDQSEEGGTTGASGAVKDPTKASPKLREAMTPAKPGTAPAVAPRLPVVTLRGRVIARNRPPTALLEVEGKMYIVGKGSIIAGPNSTILRVTDLSINDVRVEVGPLNETIILRELT